MLTTPQKYFVNLAIQNNAGTRITATWRDGIKEVDVDEGSMGTFEFNVTSYQKELPKYYLNVIRYGTNISELVNNQQVVEILPTLTQQSPVNYVVTTSGQFCLLYTSDAADE